jgi:hypothetical protein
MKTEAIIVAIVFILCTIFTVFQPQLTGILDRTGH